VVKFGKRVRAWESLPHAKLCRNRLRGYTPLGQLYTKNTNFGDFGACKPIFLNPQSLACGYGLGTPSPRLFLQKTLKGPALLHCPAEVMHIDF